MSAPGRLIGALLLALGSAALAQAPAPAEDLSSKATDPTASLMSFQLLNWYTPSYHGSGDLDSTNQVVLRAAIPFEMFGKPNIMRITQPSYTSSPAGDTGLGDTQVFNLTVFGQPWGRLAAGVVLLLPTGSDGLCAEKWAAGPALGFINVQTKGINWGLFGQTFFSFAGKDEAADVGIVNLQPIFSYQLGGGRSLSLGNSAFIYNTEKSRWESLALGVNYGQVVGFWGEKWRPNVELDYDFRDTPGNQKWVFRVGIALLIPS